MIQDTSPSVGDVERADAVFVLEEDVTNAASQWAHYSQRRLPSVSTITTQFGRDYPKHGVEDTMKAIWRGEVIAQSDRTLEMEGYRYFPRDTVRMELLRVAPKTESDLACPNGVQFYDIAEDSARSERAAWSYERPTQAPMKPVDHWIAFWADDVEIA